MIPTLSARSSNTKPTPHPPACAHCWTRRPDCDRRADVLAYRCEACVARGERRFGTHEDVRVVEPLPHHYWHRGRVRTEREQHRSIYSQLDVEDLIFGEPLTLAAHIRS